MASTFSSAVALITAGDLHSLERSLNNKHVSPDERDENGQTLLMIAAQYGQLPIVEELIRQGADIHLEDLDNWTALLNAAKEGYTDIVSELVMHNADIEHRDMGGWTALMWACYKGHTETARYLLEQGAFPNVHDLNHMSCLIWAAGRGHQSIVGDLLSYGAKVNSGDKYGTTPLVWACRRGFTGIVEMLLEAGANVDTAGMYSWTALIIATKGNYSDIVSMLLEYKPNVNAIDADGYTALAIACKEGFTDIAVSLLNAGAYVNMHDRSGDTNLIHAAKAGNFSIVDVLLKKYADVDVQGMDRKTALYWAVEKGYTDIVRVILNANPNLELATKDGDTPLMKATRIRSTDIVQMLIDKKAKVSATDKRGDTALHIAMRARSKGIVEILLRNPKNSQLLYRPNRSNETPYNIDTSHQKSILAQIFGARRLNTNEDNENMLGYDLYSSALADILSEPSLSMPISVGLYARWGSGKSFLLGKLEEDMRSFAVQWLEPTFSFTWVLFCLVSFCSSMLGYCILLATGQWLLGLSLGTGSFLLTYCILYVIRYGSSHHDWNWAYKFCIKMEHMLSSFKTVLQVIFCHPPATNKDFGSSPVRFIFTEQNKVSSSGVGDSSIAYIIISLFSAIEDEFGFFTTRFYRVFQPKPVASSSWTWRRLCCIPNFAIFLVTYLCFLGAVGVLVDMLSWNQQDGGSHTQPILISLASVVAVVMLTNLYTWVRMFLSLFRSHHRRIHSYLAHVDATSGGYMEALKGEIELMSAMVHCLDAFVRKQTRLVLIVDGLDSCEQDKVLRVLDAVYVLFSDPGHPFVTILALDPHIIIKAIEANLHRAFQNTTVRGYDYLRNIVHLPFYLQNSGLRKVRAAQQTAVGLKRSGSHWCEKEEVEKAAQGIVGTGPDRPGNRRVSNSSMSIPESFRKPSQQRKGNQKLKASESVASSMSNLHRGVTGAQDLTKVLLTDDYFSDINPRSMRRLMNIVYVTGRLLKAFNIDFNWYHLASWVNITEQWPYHTSWIILYYELHENEIDDSTSLRSIFEKIKGKVPTGKDLQPLYDVDHDVRKFEIFLSFHSASLLISDLKIFVPFTINLDPYIRRVIQERYQSQPESDRLVQKCGSGPFVPPAPPLGPVGVMGPAGTPWTPLKAELLYPQAPSTPVMSTEPYQQQPYHVWWSVGSPGTSSTMPVAPVAPLVRVWNEPFTGKLSSLTVEGVSNFLEGLEGIDKSRVPDYQSTLTRHNIHGQVLLTCNISELRDVLGMTFGDWEIFKMAILSLREQEFQRAQPSASAEDLPPMPFARDRTHSVSSAAPGDHTDSKAKDKTSDGSDKSEKMSSSHSQSTSRRPNSSLEKQVTMEESLIVGALETLSEEAMEDTLDESVAPHAGFHHSQVLSPILSDPGEGEETSGTTVRTTGDNEVDVVYLKMPHGSPKYNYSPLSASVPDYEWGVQGPSPTVYCSTDLPLESYGVSAPPSIASSPNAPPPGSFDTASFMGKLDAASQKPRNKHLDSVVAQEGMSRRGSLSRDAAESSLIDHWKGLGGSDLHQERHRLETLSLPNDAADDENAPLIEVARPMFLATMTSRDVESSSRREREFIQPFKLSRGARRFNIERQFSVDERSDIDPEEHRLDGAKSTSTASLTMLRNNADGATETSSPATALTPLSSSSGRSPEGDPKVRRSSVPSAQPDEQRSPEEGVVPSQSTPFKLPELSSRTFLRQLTDQEQKGQAGQTSCEGTSSDTVVIAGKATDAKHLFSSSETVI
ncbi:kinase D-interacting substrate of 220 kDa B [Rhipicephalus sanguineus]|uniref:kinase D-interacting substrate of 220 kDa B n=1 Tax=Rhipicephalus sanguineus TaxID=34632 RepID=UPI001894E35E|nr:kinase D-interacting substrate of 220 kDa B [Rhipicephalus sanguineus]